MENEFWVCSESLRNFLRSCGIFLSNEFLKSENKIELKL
ncbi:hypothetical protein LEP1GSC008_2935 [Leptospira kirschneri serovar Bulgarica str. Nikolaevo]|uniref:Uncharacterized protein n=1 Tax=Leptospira kirschneri serovar Bulgarica str. Nikolaevo TaxID=1240687 RepID=M6FB54_9LEPT|nr:hypothetical protein LEP1GSC008_2935 [Leptospira kirschneri serovar Bulgarica str. Nikolaevo]